MRKLKKVLKLKDPCPTAWYELSCYVKAALGTVFFILGIFLIFHPSFLIWGVVSLLLGLWFFWKIKLIRKLRKL